jgi:urea transporter
MKTSPALKAFGRWSVVDIGARSGSLITDGFVAGHEIASKEVADLKARLAGLEAVMSAVAARANLIDDPALWEEFADLLSEVPADALADRLREQEISTLVEAASFLRDELPVSAGASNLLLTEAEKFRSAPRMNS